MDQSKQQQQHQELHEIVGASQHPCDMMPQQQESGQQIISPINVDAFSEDGIRNVSAVAVDDSGNECDSQSADWLICRYFSKGLCRFGNECRFLHHQQSDIDCITENHTDGGCSASGGLDKTGTNNITNSANNKSLSTLAQLPLAPINIIPSDPNSWVMAPVFVPQQHRFTDNKQIASSISLSSPKLLHTANDSQQKTVMTLTTPPTSSSHSPQFRFDEYALGENSDQLQNKQQQDHQQQQQQHRPRTYAEVVGHSQTSVKPKKQNQVIGPTGNLLCPHIRDGDIMCRETPETCTYDHGNLCEMCNTYCLHPDDSIQRKLHENACIRQHENDMKLSFAIARSKDKTCGICFEIILEKSGREQRFGILPNCNHIFCLECIRKWRQAKQFDNKIIRACPECRVTSDFVCPSAYWVDTKEEKNKLLVDYQKALREKDCKYFKKGKGKCPFGNKCFYKHALPNGVIIDVGMPPRQIRRLNHLGEVNVLQQFLWDFMDDRDQQWLDEFVTILSEESTDDAAYEYFEVDSVL